MNFEKEVIFLGYEEKVSAKGNTYYNVALQDGGTCLTVMSKTDKIKSLKQYEPCILDFNLNTKYNNLSIVGVIA